MKITFNFLLNVKVPGRRFYGPFKVEQLYDMAGRDHNLWTALENSRKKRVNISAKRILVQCIKWPNGKFSWGWFLRETITDERKNLQRKNSNHRIIVSYQ